jgi:hypothetical protein
MHSRTMRFPVVPTITPLYLSEFTDFCAATQHGLRGRVDQLNNRGDDVVGLEGTPRGVLSPLVDPRDVYSCPSPRRPTPPPPPQLSLPPGRWGGSFNGGDGDACLDGTPSGVRSAIARPPVDDSPSLTLRSLLLRSRLL